MGQYGEIIGEEQGAMESAELIFTNTLLVNLLIDRNGLKETEASVLAQTLKTNNNKFGAFWELITWSKAL